MNKNIDRYTFYSAELGSLKHRSFRQLLLMKAPTDDQETVADLLVETTSWWIDVFAPSNEEMRAISKVSGCIVEGSIVVGLTWLKIDFSNSSTHYRGYPSSRIKREMRNISKLHVYQFQKFQS